MHVGNYTLSELLGRGGTSEVYAAEHRFLGDAVAIKLLRAGAAGDPQVRDAFVAEAARTREVQHPSIVRVIDFGHDDASGSLYLVMERIAGETLAARLRRVGRLDEPLLRRLAAAIADGMQAAHARGIVHRDLKPGNVMLRSDAGDAPVIVDFGIAKSLGASSAVHTERRIGTVAYMAPEQLTDGLVTPAADIWALGVVVYEAATGQLPFSNFADGRLPQLFDTPARAATLAPISPALDDLIARCLDRDPGRRPASMTEVATALRGESRAPWGQETIGTEQDQLGQERITADIGTPLGGARLHDVYTRDEQGRSDARLNNAYTGSGSRVHARGDQAAAADTRSRRLRGRPILAAGAVLLVGGIVIAAGVPRLFDGRHDDRSRSPTPAPQPPVATDVPAHDVPDQDVQADAAVDSAVESERARVKRKRATPPKHATTPTRKRTTSQGETLD